MKGKFKLLLIGLFMLMLLPIDTYAASGNIGMKFKYVGMDVHVTLIARVKSGTMNKYTAAYTPSEILTYKEIKTIDGINATYTDGQLTVDGVSLTAGNHDLATIVFTRSAKTSWSIKASDSKMCEGETCRSIYNNNLTSTSTSIKNPKTGLVGMIGLIIVFASSITVYNITNKKKALSKI